MSETKTLISAYPTSCMNITQVIRTKITFYFMCLLQACRKMRYAHDTDAGKVRSGDIICRVRELWVLWRCRGKHSAEKKKIFDTEEWSKQRKQRSKSTTETWSPLRSRRRADKNFVDLIDIHLPREDKQSNIK